MSLIPQFEKKDGFVLVPQEYYKKLTTALLNIAVLDVVNKEHLSEVYRTFQYCRNCARWGLGWDEEIGVECCNEYIYEQ